VNKFHWGQPLSVEVKNGRLVISIGTDVLAHAVRYSDWANPYDENANDYIRTFEVTNTEQFAQDVMRAMLREREDGSTPLSDFLDKSSESAVDDGSEAVEYEKRIPFVVGATPDAPGMQAPSGNSTVDQSNGSRDAE
jgi:hypothetical protein